MQKMETTFQQQHNQVKDSLKKLENQMQKQHAEEEQDHVQFFEQVRLNKGEVNVEINNLSKNSKVTGRLRPGARGTTKK